MAVAVGVMVAVFDFPLAVLPGVFWLAPALDHWLELLAFEVLPVLRLSPLFELVFVMVAVFCWMSGGCYFLIPSCA